MIRFLQSLFGAMLFAFSVCAGEVLLIGTADLHGNLENFSYLAPEISKYPQAIKIDIGDFVQGDFDCVYSCGLPMLEAFNELKYDLFVPGNHEFEFPEETFDTWRKYFSGKILGVQWRFGKFVPNSWSIIERDNYRIGIVGLGEVAMSKRAKIFAPLHWTDEIEAIEKLMPEIRKAKCDALVLAAHVALKGNFGELYRILQKFPEFDAVIAAHSHKEHPGSIVAKKIAVQPGPFGESAALLRFYFDDKTGKLVEIKSELLRKRTNQNQKILEICSRAKQKSLTAAREKLGNFSRSSEFGNFCAGKIREYFKCDAAFFSMNEKFFIPGTMTGKKLFKLMPYGNRICMVKGDGKDFEKLMKKLSTPWRQIYFSGKLVGNDICVAMSDHLFLLYQNINKNKVYDAEMTGVFEREIIRQALKKEFNKNILE